MKKTLFVCLMIMSSAAWASEKTYSLQEIYNFAEEDLARLRTEHPHDTFDASFMPCNDETALKLSKPMKYKGKTCSHMHYAIIHNVNVASAIQKSQENKEN